MTNTIGVANTIADVISESAPVVERKNGPKEIMAFFSVPTKGVCTDYPSDGKVTMPEYRDFWTSLSEDEKAFYRQVELV